MNISGIGSQSSAPAGSGRPANVAYQAASQRLLKVQGDEGMWSGSGAIGNDVEKAHLVPSRSREEKEARQLLQRRLELGRILHSSVSDDFMRTVFTGRILLERVPSFLKKIVSNKPMSFVNDEDSQDDILDNDFIREALLWHNIYRRHHNTPPLKISAHLCGKAQAWANHLAHTNTFAYENDKSVGQNIFCRLAQDAQTDTTAQETVSFWYSCYKNYTYNKEPDTLHININSGNFTQIVWKSTKYFGIGRARSRAGKMLIVANYQPPGNISGCFKENVLPVLANKDFV
ncbi:hypothetical protein V9T40_001408 [Parthenolecanium corni]|uniref:SCP domain-containing protein n=1 Tax=Parthenolecanium corni TaxID=536013 RepID=A0AAN9TEW5_9HEMI